MIAADSGGETMNFVLKWIAVLAVMGIGLFFIVQGLGFDVPIIEYKGLKAHNVPVGLVIFAGGIVLAAVWKVETSTKTTIENKLGKITIEKVKKMFRGGFN